MTAGKKELESGRRVDEEQRSPRSDTADTPPDDPSQRSSEDANPSLRKFAEDVAKAEEDPTSNTPPANPNTND